MTAQSSAVNSGGVFYKFLPYYLYKVKYLRSQMIMSIIFSVLSYPLMGAVLIPTFTAAKEYCDLPYSMSTAASDEAMMALRAAQARLDEMSQYAITAIVIACLCLVGLFIFTFVTTLRSFRYLYNKTVVDMDYSLPISHNTRFFGDLAAVFTVSILPHLVAAIIGSILLGFCPLSENMGSMCAIPVAIGQAAVTGVFSCIMLIAICLLMLSFCGRMAEACIYPILVNFAIPVIHSLVIDLVESGVFGAVVTESSSDVFSRYFAISSTSPLGLITMTIYSWCATADSSGELGAAPVSRPEFLIPAILITLACMAGAYFLIKHRRAERVGMSYVYKGMDLIIPGIVIFAMTMPVCSSVISNLKAGSNIPPIVYNGDPVSTSGLVLGTLITTFIVYIIMELISGKNFRKFWQSALKWAGTLAASILVCVLLHSSNGFGAAYYVPQPSTVKSVGVYYYDGRDDDNNYLIQKQFRFYAEKGDDELLALAEKLHSEILDNGMKASSDRCYVAFNYVMNDGSSLCREYRIDEALFDSIREQIITPEIWRLDQLYMLRNRDHSDMSLTSVSVGDELIDITDADALDVFSKAVEEDSLKISADFVENERQWQSIYLDLHFSWDDKEGTRIKSYSLLIYDWMENTISLLKSWGIDVMAALDPANYGTALIVKINNWVDTDLAIALSDGMTEDEFRYVNGYGDSIDLAQMTIGRIDPGEPQLKKLIEDCGSASNGEYVILLYTAASWSDYRAEDERNVRYVYVPEEYYETARRLLEENLIYEADSAAAEILY